MPTEEREGEHRIYAVFCPDAGLHSCHSEEERARVRAKALDQFNPQCSGPHVVKRREGDQWGDM